MNRPRSNFSRVRARGLVAGLLGWFFLAAVALHAASFSVSFDHESVEAGDATFLNLTFEDISMARPPELPAIPKATIRYLGPTRQFSIANGKTSSSTTHRFSFVPQVDGEFVIPSLSVTVDGQTYQSQPARLRVTKRGQPGNDLGDRLVTLKLELPRDEVYLGEAVPFAVKLYFRGGSVKNVSPPKVSMDGFVLGKAAPAEQSQLKLGGQPYSVVTWRLTATAAKLGTLPFGPAETEAVVQVPSRGGRFPIGGDPFEDFFGELRRTTLHSETNELRVISPPADGRPAGFDGAIGQFHMSVAATTNAVPLGDPITLRVQISGRGNLEQLRMPGLASTQGFTVYDATGRVESNDPLGIEGTKSFEQVLAPQSPEVRALPEIRFSYFDPEAKRYQTLTQSALPLTVRGATNSQAAPSRLALTKPDDAVNPSPDELHDIKLQPGLPRRRLTPLVARPWFLTLMLLPVPAAAALVSVQNWRDKWANDPRRQRRRRSQRAVSDGLASLESHAAEQDFHAFFDALTSVLQERIGLALDLPSSAITGDIVDERLLPLGLGEGDLSGIRDLFDAVAQARYAPVVSPQALEALRQKAVAMCWALDELEARR